MAQLLLLLVIYAVSAIMSGVTNNQVELSTKLLDDYTIHLMAEQMVLEKDMASVERDALRFLSFHTDAANTSTACEAKVTEISDKAESLPCKLLRSEEFHRTLFNCRWHAYICDIPINRGINKGNNMVFNLQSPERISLPGLCFSH